MLDSKALTFTLSTLSSIKIIQSGAILSLIFLAYNDLQSTAIVEAAVLLTIGVSSLQSSFIKFYNSSCSSSFTFLKHTPNNVQAEILDG
jgi:hypothetical protein